MYKFTGYAAKAILSLRGGIKVYNKENLPKDTGFVIACTHAGWVDVVAPVSYTHLTLPTTPYV